MPQPFDPEKLKQGLAQALDDVSRSTRETSGRLLGRARSFREAAEDLLDGQTDSEQDPYEQAVVDYNAAHTSMTDRGFALLRQRERSADLLEHVEYLINSIANTPRAFEKAFEAIELNRTAFLEAEEFARRDLEAARASAFGAGAGITAGAALASLAPTAAMWAATTFGAASTGTAISTLSGAAATNAALAWLGGGALAAGGGGTAMGGALLALAGPIGWTVAGAALLTSIVLFTKKRFETREAKHDALLGVRENTGAVKALDTQIEALLGQSTSLRELLLKNYEQSIGTFSQDFDALSDAEQSQLASLVNTASACAILLGRRIVPGTARD
ncbi:hypothetical protein BIV03_04725 [Curtobacterium sp. MCBA15_016]|uniref:hypothetical protein n=1 Tax=Curtobacterium sp. MCBA15_016 TaxID=1898740 RepID=UPI0008DE76E3|nr:hypothetical protein [Curtobacterium sp. MCBA15_016]OII16982.1 hypothetical protein BIV03_04725 [Curtobacterium sp. MCBA15_016]